MLKFVAVGAMGFVADAFTFYVCLHFVSLDVSVARIVAFTLAAFVTWLGNRFFTFAHRQQHKASRQWWWHLCVAVFGFALNFMAFSYLLSLDVALPVAFVCATAIAMISNYLLSHFFVFRARATHRDVSSC